MAVFTAVSREALEQWLTGFEVGRLLHFEGIAAGIENTNYFVDTESGRWVLTLFERLDPASLSFYLELMRHLAARGIPCPNPMPDRNGAVSAMLAGRPAALVTRLPGRSVHGPDPSQCGQVGLCLARMHQAAADVAHPLPNPRGLSWCQSMAPRVSPFLSGEQAELLADEMQAQAVFEAGPARQALPGGAVHADLFRDNALFEGTRLGGVIDFYFAGVDAWLFDLAVTCNDWCIQEASGVFDPERLTSLLAGYQAQRPLLAVETQAWPIMLRRAALRFWMSRLADFHLPRPAELLAPKDPAHFERILRARRQHVPALTPRGTPE